MSPDVSEGDLVTFEWVDGTTKTGTVTSLWEDHTAESPPSATVSVPSGEYRFGQGHDIALAWVETVNPTIGEQ